MRDVHIDPSNAGRGAEMIASLVRAEAVETDRDHLKTGVPQHIERHVQGVSSHSITISSPNLVKYAIVCAVVGGLAPLVASYMTGTYNEMKPIADKAAAAVSFTITGAVLGATLGVLADAVESSINRYMPRRNINTLKK